jgi:integrase
MAKFRMADGGELSLKHTIVDIDRHGNQRVYFRKAGAAKVRLLEKPGSEAFLEEYRRAAMGGLCRTDAGAARPAGGSLAWLILRYFQSAEFKRLHRTTQRVRRLILGHIAHADGEKPYHLLHTRHVRRMRDLRSDKPEAANSYLKALRAVFKWATSPGVDLATENPVEKVAYFAPKTSGYHSWTEAEIARFEATHPIGTKARLALALLLYTGQRRSDVVLLGPCHSHEGWFHFTQHKNKDRKPIYLEIAVQPALQSILDTTELGQSTYLVNARATPFTVASFGNWFRVQCDLAGLKHCSSHGLRKAAARRLAENYRTGHQIMAVTGHQTLKEVDRYTRAVNQRRLAAQAFQTGNA